MSESAPMKLPNHLSPDREVHVVISTLSGSKEAQQYYHDTLAPFIAKNVPHLELKKNYFTHTTTSRTFITELTIKLFLFNAKKGVKTTILLLSGDGGIVDIINTLTTTLQREIHDTRPPSIFFKPIICLFPLGTANALAHSIGVVGKGPLDVLMTGRARPLAQFEVTFSQSAKLVADEGRQRLGFRRPGGKAEQGDESELGYDDPDGNVRVYGCVVFSWGLHASLVALSDTAELRQHGVERFKMAAGDLLKEDHVYSARVKVRAERGGQWKPLWHVDEASGDHAKPAPNFGVIEGKKLNKKGNILDEEGDMLVELIEGDPQVCAGRIPSKTGEVLDNDNNVIGRVRFTFLEEADTGSRKHKYILATMVSNLEEKFCISPNSKPMDGSMRLLAIGNHSSDVLMKVLTQAYEQGKHVEASKDIVTYQDIDSLRIEFDEPDEKWRQICIDGKIVAIEDGGWVEVRKMAAGGVDGRRVIEVAKQ